MDIVQSVLQLQQNVSLLQGRKNTIITLYEKTNQMINDCKHTLVWHSERLLKMRSSCCRMASFGALNIALQIAELILVAAFIGSVSWLVTGANVAFSSVAAILSCLALWKRAQCGRRRSEIQRELAHLNRLADKLTELKGLIYGFHS